ncbi:ATP-binding protein [Streptomyces sp. AV19]|nr:ATP-binding protein [Streptomyces sp. AV19]
MPRDPRGPGIARATLRAVLGAHELHELMDRAEVLTSELATNSVRYADGPATVRLCWTHPVLRISVADTGPDFAVPSAPPHAEAGQGRGLLILGLIAHRWGRFPLGPPGPFGAAGKVTWFELVLDPGPPPGCVPALAA